MTKKPIYLICWLLSMAFAVSCSGDDVEEPKEPEVEKPEPEKPEPKPEEPSEDLNKTLDKLHIEGRYLKNSKGEIVNLHGFAQTYSPFFNQFNWNNYDVDGCLRYNKRMIDNVLAVGWKMTFIRQHMDPYWSSPNSEGEDKAYVTYDETRFKKYLDEVFVPMAEYAVSKGLYVVMRPPGVSPQTIAVDDAYHKYLLRIWEIVSQHPKIKNNSAIMFELANEPIHIVGTDGVAGATSDACFESLNIFFQRIVDVIRKNASNIIWVPGLGYQSQYAGYAKYPIKGTDIGYAIHLYPGWMGSDGENQDGGVGIGGGYEAFQRGWDTQVKPAADIAPIMVTEMDWAPAKYDASWGKAVTGVAGGAGFGANFKYIVDNSGNVSWLLWTTQEWLVQFVDEPGKEGEYTFLNDPEACPWPVYHWFQEYAGMETTDHGPLTGLAIENAPDGKLTLVTGANKFLRVIASYEDGTTALVSKDAVITSSDPSVVTVGENGNISAVKDGVAAIHVAYSDKYGNTKELDVEVEASTFPLTADLFNPSIWEQGSFDETERILVTGQWGFGGWEYTSGLDLSAWKYVIVELGEKTEPGSGVSFRLFDKGYWDGCAAYDMNSTNRLVVDLNDMYKDDGNGGKQKVTPSHITIVGFWSNGGKKIQIDRVYLSNEK